MLKKTSRLLRRDKGRRRNQVAGKKVESSKAAVVEKANT